MVVRNEDKGIQTFLFCFLFFISNFVNTLSAYNSTLFKEEGSDYYYNNLTAMGHEGNMLEDALLTCGDSPEATRVNLKQFLQKVQDKYFELRPQELVYKSGVSKTEFREKFRLYDPSPAHILLETMKSRQLFSEFEQMNINLNLLTPREEKAVAQVEHFLKHVFGMSFHGDYFSGEFLLGPDYFCWQPICDTPYNIYYGLRRFEPSSPEETLRLFHMVGTLFQQYKENMRYGVRAGMVHSREVCLASFDALKTQYLNIAINGPTGVLSEWWAKPLLKFPFSSNPDVIRFVGQPIHDLLSYIKNEHIMHCVPSEIVSGLASLPLDYVYFNGAATKERTLQVLPTGEPIRNGKAYNYLLSHSTTTAISPEEVYELGWEKLNDLYPQALQIAKEVTKQSDPEIAKSLFIKKINQPGMFFGSSIPQNESNPDAHKKCSNEEGAQKYCPARWAAMQKWFTFAREAMSLLKSQIGNLFYNDAENPKRTSPSCGVELKADFNPSSGAASYINSDKKCSKPATYFLPFFMNKPGPIYEEWTTNAHEARPGHHYQIQGNEELFGDKCNDAISWIESQSSITSYAEGWALYAENPLIGEDTDTYNYHPLFKYGMLKLQIWRALRLIVDAGLHYKGLKRSEATELFKKYAWDDSDKTDKEITRYQGAPGQATAYMIGQLHFKKARDFVKSKLGKRFNLKDFHYYILVTGDVPLDYMNRRMEKYAACVLEPGEAGCQLLLKPPRNDDVIHDNLQEVDSTDYQTLHDDVWVTPRRHSRRIPI